MSANERSKKATPNDILRGFLLDPREPKTEMEHFAAREIERLERELAEARASVLSLETESHANHQRAQQAEGQSAALRGALKFYALEGNYQWDIAPDPAGTAIPGTSPIDCDQGDKAQAALSTDAGRKVLDVVARMRQLIEAVDSGNLQMSSPEIGGHDDIPPHPWHEEWLHHARQALAAMGK